MEMQFTSAAELRAHYKRLTQQFYPQGKGFGCEQPTIVQPSPPEPDPPEVSAAETPATRWAELHKRTILVHQPSQPTVFLDNLPPSAQLPAFKRHRNKAERTEAARLAELQEPRISDLLERLKILTPRPNMKFIQVAVGVVWGVSPEDMRGPSRLMHILPARHAAMFLCRVIALKSYPEIGRAFGDRDHTSVINACSKYSHLIGLPRESTIPLVDLGANGKALAIPA